MNRIPRFQPIAVALLLFGCGEKSELPVASEASPPRAQPPSENTRPANNTTWTVSSVSDSSLLVYRVPDDTPRAGQRVRVTFTIPGADSPIARAEGEISEISAETFTVAVDPASRTGTPQPGDRITLLSP